MSTAKPYVSIIIPTLNRAHLIGETLDSIRAQTYTHWECIVVDDGSTDETKSVVMSYCDTDARFKYVERPSNRPKGGNAARNYGFEISKGDFIQWFDSDDLMVASMLESQINCLFDSDKKFVVCLLARCNSDFTTTIKEEPEIVIAENLYVEFILKKLKITLPTTLFCRNILLKFSLDESLYKSQEYDFFSRFLKVNHEWAKINNNVLVRVRRHKASITGSNFKENPKKLKSALDVKLNIIKQLPGGIPNSVKHKLWISYFDLLSYTFKFKMGGIFYSYLGRNVTVSLKTLFCSLYLANLYVVYLLTNFGYKYYSKGKNIIIK